MSVLSYCIFCLFNHCLMSSLLFAVVGGLSFCLLWYVALDGKFGSNCVNHSMSCSVFISSW